MLPRSAQNTRPTPSLWNGFSEFSVNISARVGKLYALPRLFLPVWPWVCRRRHQHQLPSGGRGSCRAFGRARLLPSLREGEAPAEPSGGRGSCRAFGRARLLPSLRERLGRSLALPKEEATPAAAHPGGESRRPRQPPLPKGKRTSGLGEELRQSVCQRSPCPNHSQV